MKKSINITEYLKMGGKLDKLFLPSTKTTYFDKNQDKDVKNIEYSDITTSGNRLYKVTYTDNTSHKYAGTWIKTDVDLILDEKYI